MARRSAIERQRLKKEAEHLEFLLELRERFPNDPQYQNIEKLMENYRDSLTSRWRTVQKPKSKTSRKPQVQSDRIAKMRDGEYDQYREDLLELVYSYDSGNSRDGRDSTIDFIQGGQYNTFSNNKKFDAFVANIEDEIENLRIRQLGLIKIERERKIDVTPSATKLDAEVDRLVEMIDEVELLRQDVNAELKGEYLENPHCMNPRRKNPSKSVLGALILGGIIGHSMKKK